jgi:hypothetical protein
VYAGAGATWQVGMVCGKLCAYNYGPTKFMSQQDFDCWLREEGPEMH